MSLQYVTLTRRMNESLFFVLLAVMIRLTELLLFQHGVTLQMCWRKHSVFILVHPCPKLFFFFTPLWCHFTSSMFFFHYVNIFIAKEYKETALGFCIKCMTLSKHWNDLCKWKYGLSTFLSKHKLTIVFGFSNAFGALYETVVSSWCMVVV